MQIAALRAPANRALVCGVFSGFIFPAFHVVESQSGNLLTAGPVGLGCVVSLVGFTFTAKAMELILKDGTRKTDCRRCHRVNVAMRLGVICDECAGVVGLPDSEVVRPKPTRPSRVSKRAEKWRARLTQVAEVVEENLIRLCVTERLHRLEAIQDRWDALRAAKMLSPRKIHATIEAQERGKVVEAPIDPSRLSPLPKC
jgi:hypothetical protein